MYPKFLEINLVVVVRHSEYAQYAIESIRRNFELQIHAPCYVPPLRNILLTQIESCVAW